MRKNTARHWLHAGLDLLPLILIPVFMIYSHRHTIDSGSIEVPINKVVDFNQLVKNGNFTNTDYWTPQYSASFNVSNNIASIESSTRFSQISQDIDLLKDHVYYFKFNYDTDVNNSWCYFFYNYTANVIDGGKHYLSSSNNEINYILNSSYSGNTQVAFQYDNVDDSTLLLTGDVQLFDLTQMFGSGNEPTSQQFNDWYSNDYYDYTLSHKELLKGYSNQTYDDADIMSQFTYQLYNSVDKYFNMGNVFGMSNVYDWFVLNIFGGNASISIYIVWNIVLYEFVMDLLFLLYALFMWFIDVTKRLIEKPLDSIK